MFHHVKTNFSTLINKSKAKVSVNKQQKLMNNVYINDDINLKKQI